MSRAHAQPSARALIAWVRLTRRDPMDWDGAWHRSRFVGALGLSRTQAYYGYQWQQIVFVVRYTPESRQHHRKMVVRWVIADVWAAAHWQRAVARYDTVGRVLQ